MCRDGAPTTDWIRVVAGDLLRQIDRGLGSKK
jgi:hypothetical protein